MGRRIGVLREILDQIAQQLSDAYDDLDVPVQVVPRAWFNPTPPCIDMWPGETTRDPNSAAFGDIDGGYVVTLRARVSTADGDAGQDLLVAFLDDTDDLCIARPLFDEPTLGGIASSILVEPPLGPFQYPDPSGEGSLWGYTWRVTVLAIQS